ncbi:MAG: hypothetical protein HAW67_05390 [Endozoicomonadaceae bacterium]|nr:hypothetical protein [Endozoicomonadaceae bacterium]
MNPMTDKHFETYLNLMIEDRNSELNDYLKLNGLIYTEIIEETLRDNGIQRLKLAIKTNSVSEPLLTLKQFAIELACIRNLWDSVNLLLSIGPKAEKKEVHVIVASKNHAPIGVIKKLVKSIDACQDTVEDLTDCFIWSALSSNHINAIHYLITQTEDLNDIFDTMLEHVARRGQGEILELMLLNSNLSDFTLTEAMNEALENNHFDCADHIYQNINFSFFDFDDPELKSHEKAADYIKAKHLNDTLELELLKTVSVKIKQEEDTRSATISAVTNSI